MKKLNILIIFLFLTILSFSNQGIGDMDVNINLIPSSKTKKYNINGSILLDAGDINSKDLGNIVEKKIADVKVNMQTKQTTQKSREIDYCIIEGDGDFSTGYKIKELKNLEGKIPTSSLKKYYGGDSLELELYQRNFDIVSMDVQENNSSSDKYYFSAYPNQCKTMNNWNKVNTITHFEYSFEIWIKVSNAKAKDIVKADVNVGSNGAGNEEATGALKDLVRDQFKKLQTIK